MNIYFLKAIFLAESIQFTKLQCSRHSWFLRGATESRLCCGFFQDSVF